MVNNCRRKKNAKNIWKAKCYGRLEDSENVYKPPTVVIFDKHLMNQALYIICINIFI